MFWWIDWIRKSEAKCNRCSGEGQVENKTCGECRGVGSTLEQAANAHKIKVWRVHFSFVCCVVITFAYAIILDLFGEKLLAIPEFIKFPPALFFLFFFISYALWHEVDDWVKIDNKRLQKESEMLRKYPQ